MKLQMILALASNGALGKAGKLPWSHPVDRAHFEDTTHNHVVIMGRRTWEEEGIPLPNRTNIVISRHTKTPANRDVEHRHRASHDIERRHRASRDIERGRRASCGFERRHRASRFHAR